MKKRNSIPCMASLALPVLCMVAFSNAEARPPRSASSTATYTGPAGNTASKQSSTSTTGQGGYAHNATVTGPAGNSATRQASGSYNSSTQTLTRSATTTGPAGKQATSTSSIQATGNGYQRSATHTGPNGNSVTAQGQANYNSSTGTINQGRTVTGPNGKTSTESRTIQTGTPSASANN
jgi:hypothetical protein